MDNYCGLHLCSIISKMVLVKVNNSDKGNGWPLTPASSMATRLHEFTSISFNHTGYPDITIATNATEINKQS